MNQKELRELIEFLIEKDITEFELERGDVKVRIKRGTPEATSAPADNYHCASGTGCKPANRGTAGCPRPRGCASAC